MTMNGSILNGGEKTGFSNYLNIRILNQMLRSSFSKWQ